jgi:hypothetical protein
MAKTVKPTRYWKILFTDGKDAYFKTDIPLTQDCKPDSSFMILTHNVAQEHGYSSQEISKITEIDRATFLKKYIN